MPNNRNLTDALLKSTVALPVSGVTAESAIIETGNSPNGDFVADVEFKLTVPALTTTQLPNGIVNTYTLESDTSAGFSSPTTVATFGTQTGAGGAGAAANEFRVRLPARTESHVRAKVATTGSANQAAASMVLEVVS